MPGAEHPGTAHVLASLEAIHARLATLEGAIRTTAAEASRAAGGLREAEKPAWLRKTAGETRWGVAVCTAAAIALQLPVPGRLVLARPSWVLPLCEALLLIGLVAANPHRINRESRVLRSLSLGLATLISLANAWAAAELVTELIGGRGPSTAGPLLVTGGSIWVTNVIVFALWYWEFDQGGPVARANLDRKRYPDFLFPQMTVSDNPHLSAKDWEPAFADYLYLAFTNATAFSPTDTLPLSRWAKLAMTLQSAVSLITAALLIARAVNVLK